MNYWEFNLVQQQTKLRKHLEKKQLENIQIKEEILKRYKVKFNNKFKKLTEAYEILSNPEKKDLYDRFGMEGVKNGGGGGDMSDIFSQFFGGGRKETGPKKMKAKLRELEVSLEDVYEGKIIPLKHKRKRVCEGCEGKGGANSK